MKTDWKHAEAETVVALFRDSLRDSISDHQVILDLLIKRQEELPLDIGGDLGDLLEHASDVYMAMSENIGRTFLISRSRR